MGIIQNLGERFGDMVASSFVVDDPTNLTTSESSDSFYKTVTRDTETSLSGNYDYFSMGTSPVPSSQIPTCIFLVAESNIQARSVY